MRIAMVSVQASPLAAPGDVTGQGIRVAELSAELVRRGHQVTVYTRRGSPDDADRVELPTGVIVEHVPAGPAKELGKDDLLPFMPGFGAYLAGRWSAEAPDVVHAHFWLSGIAAVAGARGLGIPVVQTFHSLGVVRKRYHGTKDGSPAQRIRLERAVGRDVDSVVATCSDEVFELVRMGVSRRKITVVPGGVDCARFTPGGARASRGKRSRLLWLGRLTERKGVDTIIEALPRLPGVELIIAGGPERWRLAQHDEACRLLDLARRTQVAERVCFLGQVERPDVPALIRSADIVVSTPWYEPFGLVPLEAMSCGITVVVSAVGGLADTVVHGATGVHIPPRRSDVLGLAVRNLLADPVRREAYGIAGVDRARSRYTWDRIAGETLSAYEGVMAHPELAAVAGH